MVKEMKKTKKLNIGNYKESRSFNNEGTAFSFNGGEQMNELKLIGVIEEPHGHKNAVKVKPVNGGIEDILNLKNVTLVDSRNNRISKEVYEVRKYRRGRFLVKFCGFKWRSEVEKYMNWVMAVPEVNV
jgi:ribosomal 30S subunit maturation factor RimM